MKKIFSAILALAACLSSVSAQAGLLDSVSFTDAETGDMRISGDVGGRLNNRNVSLFIVDADKSPFGGGEFPLYVGGETLSYEGKYTHTHRFTSELKPIKIVAVLGGAVEEKIINYAPGAWLNENIYGAIAGGALGGEALADMLKRYDIMLGLDLSKLTSARERHILIKRVTANKGSFKAGKNEIINNIFAEIELLKAIEASLHWSGTEQLIKDSIALTGIDLSGYNALSPAQKSVAAGELTGKSYNDYNALGDALQAAVTAAAAGNGGGAEKIIGGGVGSGGGGGGGGYVPPEKLPDGSEIVPPEQIGFTDLDSAEWAKEAIYALRARNIVSGVDGRTFAPGRSVTREEFVKLAVLAFGFEDAVTSADFDDVPAERWSYPYVSAAAGIGAVNGVGGGRFAPAEPVTREDMAVILHRCAEKAGMSLNAKTESFGDWDEISEYARDAVALLAAARFINGVGDSRFAPKENATRAEAAKVIYEIRKGAWANE